MDKIELWTYGDYDLLNDIDFGISFEVPKDWLQKRVKQLGFDCDIFFSGLYMGFIRSLI